MALEDDWLYSDSRMNLRAQCLKTLLRTFGSHIKEDGTPEHSTESIYACAHDWVSQGHPTTDGILEYYEDYYEADS